MFSLRQFIWLCALLCSRVLASAATDPVLEFQWAVSGGGINADIGFAIAVDSAGNSYVTGNFDGISTFGSTTRTGAFDAFVAKLDNLGVLQWVRTIGGTNSDQGHAITVDTQGNCYVAGNFSGVVDFGGAVLTATDSGDIFVAKYNSAGQLQWARRAGSTTRFDTDQARGIAVDGSGNCYITGYIPEQAVFGSITTPPNAGGFDFYLAKYDSNGTIQWVQTAAEFASDRGLALALDPLGNVYVTGHFENTIAFGSSILTRVGKDDAFIVKYNSAGVVQWARSGGSSDLDEGRGIAVDKLGNAYVTGYFSKNAQFGSTTLTNFTGENSDMFIAKYDSAGAFQWARGIGGNDPEVGNAVAVDAAGNCYVAGKFVLGVLAKYNTSGTLQWVQSYEQLQPFASASAFGVGLDELGNCYITGSFNQSIRLGTTTLNALTSNNPAASDFYVAKLSFINHAPAFMKGSDQVVLEDSGLTMVTNWATNINPGSVNESGQALAFVLTNDNTNLFSVQPALDAKGTLTFAPATNANGQAQVSVVLLDNGGSANGGMDISITQTFNIVVTPVNDAPFAQSVLVSTDQNTSLSFTLPAFDADLDSLLFIFDSFPTNGQLSGVAPDLIYVPKVNYFGPDSFQFHVSDGSLVSTQATVRIIVNRVNQAPVADASATRTLVLSPNNTNALVLLDGSRSFDSDGDPLDYKWFFPGTNQLLATGVVALVELPLGTNAISLIVSDGMAISMTGIGVEVLTSAQAVARLVGIINSDISRSQPLVATLNAAIASIDRSNPAAAFNQLKAFQEKIHVQVEPLNPGLAAALIQTSQLVIDNLKEELAGRNGTRQMRLEHLSRTAEGRVRLQFTGPPGFIYAIEGSTNMMSWETLGAAVLHAGGTFEFEDPQASKLAARFYRISAQ